MLWLLTIPFIAYFTFRDMYHSGFPDLDPDSVSRGFLAWAFLIFMSLLFTVFISSVPVGLACFIGSQRSYQGVKDKVYPLMTLGERQGFRGQSYFLGIGAIDNVEYYSWYRIHEDGSIRGGKTRRHEGVRIFTSNNPCMVTYATQFSGHDLVWKLIGIDTRDHDYHWNPVFYIPKGSIKEGFSL
jgi:hypothetical protein